MKADLEARYHTFDESRSTIELREDYGGPSRLELAFPTLVHWDGQDPQYGAIQYHMSLFRRERLKAEVWCETWFGELREWVRSIEEWVQGGRRNLRLNTLYDDFELSAWNSAGVHVRGSIRVKTRSLLRKRPTGGATLLPESGSLRKETFVSMHFRCEATCRLLTEGLGWLIEDGEAAVCRR